ncbi:MULTISPECIES: YceD family protein [Sporosarcina]|uniref:YceD family protein n=1 Tax=Sporosarcina saromensis TaxID=359365 RepID=A0ABU4G4J5_9BACL|nr:YceD family protein [Sporosarcina saromensis]MDW0111882.1 YceD family protein [Sporosarcina saromensis]
MKWSIHQLQKYRQGAMPLDEAINLDSVKKRNPEIRDIQPVHVTGSCVIGSKKLTCHFHLEGEMTLPCSRTWEDVKLPFSIETDEQFSWDEATLAADDSIHPVIGEVVDPTPVFEELILLEVPLQIFSEKANEMKSAEGKGWSYTTDEEYDAQQREGKENKVDPRLAGLAGFFDSEKK